MALFHKKIIRVSLAQDLNDTCITLNRKSINYMCGISSYVGSDILSRWNIALGEPSSPHRL